jgi:hypothetical protein
LTNSTLFSRSEGHLHRLASKVHTHTHTRARVNTNTHVALLRHDFAPSGPSLKWPFVAPQALSADLSESLCLCPLTGALDILVRDVRHALEFQDGKRFLKQDRLRDRLSLLLATWQEA